MVLAGAAPRGGSRSRGCWGVHDRSVFVGGGMSHFSVLSCERQFLNDAEPPDEDVLLTIDD